MRPRLVLRLLALATIAVAMTAPAALAAHRRSIGLPAPALTRALNRSMGPAGADSGAEVVDLDTGATLYARDATVGRLPASVEKLWTTSTALALFGPDARLQTTVLGTSARDGATYAGTLYLRGGGDPTFGSAAFDHRAYGTGATVQALVAGLRARGIRRVTGPIVADASLFDSDEGTVATGNRPSIEVEGALGALTFDRGWADSDGAAYVAHPAIAAGVQFVAALRAAGIRVLDGRVRAGVTPAGAAPLASVDSPPMATLVRLTNTPSDNFFAETLLKDIGARFGAGGTTPDGAAVVRRTVAERFDLQPRLDDGSGLSYFDRTTPAQAISLLTQQQHDAPFRNSLAVVGETGTLADENRGTIAAGRCTGKTGTLAAVSNVVGYCATADGDTLAYAILMNGVDPDSAHVLQDAMEVAIARYDG